MEAALPPDADLMPAVILCYLLQPTNGLFNAIIYIRPRFTRIRKEHSNISRTKALWLVVTDVADDKIGDHNPSTMVDGGPEGADNLADDDENAVVEVFGSTEFGGGSKPFSCNGGSRQFALSKIEESVSASDDPFAAQLLDSCVADRDPPGAKKARSDSPDAEENCQDFTC